MTPPSSSATNHSTMDRKQMEVGDGTMRKRALSSIRTTAAAPSLDGGEVMGEPVSPSSRLVDDFVVIVLIGLGSPVDLPGFRAGIGARMACHPRFHSIQATDKDGVLRWVPTSVSMDHHIFVPALDLGAGADPDQAVEDYVASLYTRSMDRSRPLWDFHFLDFPTSEAASTCVVRLHHSLGDGMSLLTLLLSSTRSAADPTRLPAMPPVPKRTSAIYLGPRPPASAGALAWTWWVWSLLLLAWHTVVDVAIFLATLLFLKDTPTLFKAVEFHSKGKRIVHRSLSLVDVKAVKEAMNCTVNDVLVGVADAALSRYYHRKTGHTGTGKKIRLRSILPVNLRPATSDMHEFVKMIESGQASDVKWGNEVGLIILPLRIGMQNDPLDYVRKAKHTLDRKKSSLEVAFTSLAAQVFFKVFGPKAGAAIIYRILSHTTTSLSNTVGPVEDVEFCGHPFVFIAPTTFIPGEAIVMNYQSYVNTVRIVLSVDEAQFTDCHDLLDDFAESLKRIKDAATSIEKHN